MNGSESKTPMFVRKTEPAYMSIRKTGQVTGLGESFIRNGVKKGTVPGFYVAGEGSKFMVNVPLLMAVLEQRSMDSMTATEGASV